MNEGSRKPAGQYSSAIAIGVGILTFFSLILVVSDYYTVDASALRFSSYIGLLFLIYSICAVRVSKFSLISLFVLCGLVILVGIKSTQDINIFFKYLVLMLAFFACQFQVRAYNIDLFFNSLLLVFILLLGIGFAQLLMILLSPAQYLGWSGGHFRPIGLSVEPTFYSQQLLFCWLFLVKEGKLKGLFFVGTLLILILLLISTATRTSLLIFALFFLLNFTRYFRSIMSLVPVLMLFIFNYIDQVSPLLQSFVIKAGNIVNIEGEPRSVAFSEMVLLLSEMPLTGYGFNSFSSVGGLEIGSLYAIEPVAAVYSMGILAFPFLIWFSLAVAKGVLDRKFTLTAGLLICMLAMPFLFTPFGMIVLVLYSILPRRPSGQGTVAS